MTTPDINTLDLKVPDPVDWDEELPSGGGGETLPKGEYLMQVVPGSAEFKPDKDGYLFMTVTLKVMDGPYAGTEARFQRFTTRPYSEKMRRKGSEAADLIKATGCGLRPVSPSEWEQAMKAQEGLMAKFYGDWEAYDREETNKDRQRVRGMVNFPVDEEGKRLSYLKKVDVASGNAYTVFANWRWSRVRPVAA